MLAAPWRHKSDVRQWTSDIRQYVLDTFVRDFDPDKEDRGLLRSLMQKVELDRDSKVGCFVCNKCRKIFSIVVLRTRTAR